MTESIALIQSLGAATKKGSITLSTYSGNKELWKGSVWKRAGVSGLNEGSAAPLNTMIRGHSEPCRS